MPHSSQHVFRHLYFMEVLSGVSEVLNAAGMTLVLSTTQTEIAEEEAYVKVLHSQIVDGVILASAALNDKNIATLQLSSLPFVFIGRYPLDRAYVRSPSTTKVARTSGQAPHLAWAQAHRTYKRPPRLTSRR